MNIFNSNTNQAIGGLAIVTFHDFTHVNILDRVLVRAKAEFTAHAIKVGGPQCFAEGVFVIGVGSFQRTQNQVGGVVTLCRVKRRHTVIGRLETLDKAVVGFVFKVISP